MKKVSCFKFQQHRTIGQSKAQGIIKNSAVGTNKYVEPRRWITDEIIYDTLLSSN